MAKRIYWESVKKWAIRAGIPSGVAGFALLFYYLIFIEAIVVTGYSGDMICEGTEENPCLAYINFTANEDVFLYPIGYDPWGRDTPFETDKELKSWKIYRSWGKGWREIKLDQTCTGTWCGAPNNLGVKYSFVFREDRNYRIKIVAYKNNPYEDVKWGFGPVDPYWYGKDEIENLGDSYVYYGSTGTNYGSEGVLKVGGRSFGVKYRRTYINFNISSIPLDATIENATLFLYKYSYDTSYSETTNDIYYIYSVNATWSEGSITWNNQPCGADWDASADCDLEGWVKIPVSGNWVNWTVTDVIKDYISSANNVSFGIKWKDESAYDTTYFASKENGTVAIRPYLNITWSRPPTIDIIKTFDESYVENGTFNQGDKVIIRANITSARQDLVGSAWLSIFNTTGDINVTNQTMVNVGSIADGYIYEYNYTLSATADKGLWELIIYANSTGGDETSMSGVFTVEPTWVLDIVNPTINSSINEEIIINLNYTVNSLPVDSSISVTNITIGDKSCEVSKKYSGTNKTVTLNYTYILADTHVKKRDGSDTSNVNYGSNTLLKARDGSIIYGIGSSYLYPNRVYIKVNLSDLPAGEIKEVRLYLYTMGESSLEDEPIKMHQIYNTTWVENTITWNNQPCGNHTPEDNYIDYAICDPTILDEKLIPVSEYVGEYVGFNITSAVNNSVVTFLLTNEWSGASYTMDFDSKEGTNKPYIEIEYYNQTENIEYNSSSGLWNVKCEVDSAISLGAKDLFVEVNYTKTSISRKDNKTEASAINIGKSIPDWRSQGQSSSVINNTDTNYLWAEGLDYLNLKEAWLETNETGEWRNISSPTLLWTGLYTGVLDSFSSPMYEDGVLYFRSEKYKFVFAINSSTGRVIWSTVTGDTDDGSVAIDGDIIFTVGNGGKAYAIYKNNGTIKWYNNLNNGSWASVVTDDDKLYSAHGNTYGGAGIRALNKTNGNLVWINGTDKKYVNSPAVHDGRLFVGATVNAFRVYNTTNGNLIWQNTSYDYWDSSPVVKNGIVYVCSLQGLDAWNETNGDTIWHQGGSCVGTIAYKDGIIAHPAKSGTLYVRNATDGSIIWSKAVDNYPGDKLYSSPLIVNDILIQGARNGTIYAFDILDGRTLWTYYLEDQIFNTPTFSDGKLFAGSDKQLYTFDFGSGDADSWLNFGREKTHGAYTPNALKSYIFSSPENLGDAENTWKYANFTWHNELFTGTVGWRIRFVDAYGNSNTTSIQTFEVQEEEPEDTCTCAGVDTNWEVDMEDYCNLTSACNLGTGNLSWIGSSGYFNCSASLNFTNRDAPPSATTFYHSDGCDIIYLIIFIFISTTIFKRKGRLIIPWQK